MTIIISVKHQSEDVYKGVKLVKAEEGTEETFYTGDLEVDYKNALKFCTGQYLILDQSVENFVREICSQRTKNDNCLYNKD